MKPQKEQLELYEKIQSSPQADACFSGRWIVVLTVLLLLVIPDESQASGMPILYFTYWLIGLSELLPLLFLCSKRMEGRCLVASLTYLVLVGALWRYVVLSLPGDRALKFSEAEWFSRTMGRKRDYLIGEFGAELGQTLFDILTFYVPFLLPPLIAWGIYLLLRRKSVADVSRPPDPLIHG